MGKKRVLHELVLTKIAAVDDPCQEPALAVLQKNKDSGDKPGKQAGESGESNEGNIMFDIKKKLGLPDTATDDQIEKAFAELEKAKTDLEAVTKAKEESDGKVTALTADLAKAKTDAEAELAKAKGDETFTKHDGSVISKNKVGADTFSMLKDMNDEIVKSRTAAETSELAKRAETEFKNIPGSIDSKVSILRLAKRAPEADRTALEELLKSHDAMVAAGMKTLGKSKPGAADENGDDPEDKLDSMAKARAEKDGIGFDAAMAKVLETSEGAALYAQIDS